MLYALFGLCGGKALIYRYTSSEAARGAAEPLLKGRDYGVLGRFPLPHPFLDPLAAAVC